jgi:MFS family permease
MGISGFTDSFLAFALMRPLLGILSSIFNPLSFSLLADYFPAERRATANSIIQSGNYIGWGLSSISILSIKAFGWRKTYGLLGAVALLVSALVLTVVKEPPKVEKKVVEKAIEESGDSAEKDGGIREVLSNPINKYTLIGAFFRNFGGSCTTFFLPLFFLKNFPAFKVQYSFVNSVILSIFGLTSGICGGIIADRFEKNTLWTKALICIIGSASALPLIGAATLQTSHFWLSMVSFMLFTLLTSSFSGPAITMMQNSSPKRVQGSIISTYFFTITLAQTLGPLVLGKLCLKFGAAANPAIYGPLITLTTLVGFVGSCPWWYLAGKNYRDFMLKKRQEEEVNDAITAVERQ